MEISVNTSLYGIIGNPLAHTLSPAVHNAAFEATGIDAVYLAFETEDPITCLKAARALPVKGFSVTIPYKSVVIDQLDFVEEEALRLGAVNTIINRKGALYGSNTDAPAALEAIEAQTELEGLNCLILGAGGAAKAVAFALKGRCGKLTVANRDGARAGALAENIGCHWLALDEAHKVKADLVVNTTPVGMHPEQNETPVSERVLEHASTVMDIIYRPRETALLKLASEMGCATISGEEMFLRQAAGQFSIWTGINPPVGVMKTAFEKSLKGTP